MLITDRPYVSHLLTTFDGTIDQFLKPVSQDGLKRIEKNVLRIQALGLPKKNEDYTKELAIKLRNLLNDKRVKGYVYLGLVPIDYSGEHVEESKTIWKHNQKDIMQMVNMKRLLESGLFNMCADLSLRMSMLKELSVALKLAQTHYDMSDSQLQTLFCKLVYWINNQLDHFYDMDNENIDYHFSRKVVYIGGPKKHELVYLELLNRLGIDVWIGDTEKKKEKLKNEQAWNIKNYAEQGRIDHTFLKNELKVQAVLYDVKQQAVLSDVKMDPLLDREMSYEELANLGQAVVLIQVYGPGEEIIGRGSGVVINNHGLIATNVHVVMKGLKYGIQFENSQEEIITERVYFLDVLNDLAILNIKRQTPSVSLKRSDDLKRGQEIVTIGSPLGLMNTISNGIVSGFRSLDGVRFIQITAPISHGSSGGALLDKFGALVGITSAGFSEGQNLNLAIPVTEVNTLLKLKWLEISEALFGLSPQLNVNGIQFMPRLSQDDNKDVIILLYPLHKDYYAYYRTCVNRGVTCFDNQIKSVLATVLSKYGIYEFDYYFLPVGDSYDQ